MRHDTSRAPPLQRIFFKINFVSDTLVAAPAEVQVYTGEDAREQTRLVEQLQWWG